MASYYPKNTFPQVSTTVWLQPTFPELLSQHTHHPHQPNGSLYKPELKFRLATPKAFFKMLSTCNVHFLFQIPKTLPVFVIW